VKADRSLLCALVVAGRYLPFRRVIQPGFPHGKQIVYKRMGAEYDSGGMVKPPDWQAESLLAK
jgi:hypothetical protein